MSCSHSKFVYPPFRVAKDFSKGSPLCMVDLEFSATSGHSVRPRGQRGVDLFFLSVRTPNASKFKIVSHQKGASAFFENGGGDDRNDNRSIIWSCPSFGVCPHELGALLLLTGSPHRRRREVHREGRRGQSLHRFALRDADGRPLSSSPLSGQGSTWPTMWFWSQIER